MENGKHAAESSKTRMESEAYQPSHQELEVRRFPHFFQGERVDCSPVR